MAKIVSIGDLVLDIIMPVKFPVRGGMHQSSSDRRIEPGGAANFIVTALNLGQQVAVAGTVGSDVYGERILAPLRECGADVRFVEVVPDTSSTLVITLTDRDSGEHVFLGHYGDGPEMDYPPGLDECIAGADAVFVEGYALVEQRVAKMALRAVEQAGKVGVPVYMDVGPLLQQADQEHVRWVLKHSFMLFFTEDEAALVTGGKLGPQAYADLLTLGPTYAVVKRGPGGCTILTTDWWLDVPAFPVPKVVDTVGAGDTFDAAFVTGMANKLEMRECALLANATGSASTLKIGSGTNAPTCAEIMAVLERAGEKINFSC